MAGFGSFTLVGVLAIYTCAGWEPFRHLHSCACYYWDTRPCIHDSTKNNGTSIYSTEDIWRVDDTIYFHFSFNKVLEIFIMIFCRITICNVFKQNLWVHMSCSIEGKRVLDTRQNKKRWNWSSLTLALFHPCRQQIHCHLLKRCDVGL